MNWQFLKKAKFKRATDKIGEKKWALSLFFRLDSFVDFLPGAIATVLVAGAYLLSLSEPLEQIAYRGLYKFRGAIAWDRRVVVIAIDDADLKELGRFPWSRQRYVELLNVLSEAQPSVVALDILFSESSPEDNQLAAAIERQGQVVLAQAWDYTGAPLLPTPELRQAAIASGHVHNQKDSDGITRWIKPQLEGVPAFALAVAQVYALTSEPITFPNLHHRLGVNWPGPVNQMPQYSFSEVIQGKVPAQTFKNKIVLVGVTATGLDTLQTPFDRIKPASGVHLHAAILNNVLRQNFVQRSAYAQWVLVLFLTAPLLSFVISRWKTEQQLLGIAGLIVAWGILSLMLFRAGYWIPVALPIGLFSVTGASMVLCDRLKMTALLQQSEERYSLAVQGSNEGLWDWNLKTGEIYFSPRWKSLVGCEEHEIGTSPLEWFNRVHPEDLERVTAEMTAHIAGLTAQFENEHRILHKDGTYRWMLSRGVAVRNTAGSAYRMAGSQTDIHSRKQAEEQLRYQAFYDRLTGLPNQAFFIECLKKAIERVNQGENDSFGVLFLDVDRFKIVNDSLGHSVGDQLLVAIARRLQACFIGTAPPLRQAGIGKPPYSNVTVARTGGDEFSILLENIRDPSDATYAAEQIHAALAAPFNLDGREFFTNACIGITLSNIGYQQPEEVLRDADIAMYHAKSLSQATYAVFNKTLHARILALLELETDLRRAIERGEFQVYYQPIVALSTGKITGFEALIRWRHPTRGMVSPLEFIPIAEDTGLIVPIGAWILREACRQLCIWQQQFSAQLTLTMNVNLSGIQFAQRGLVAQINQILQETEVEGESLKLEITESSLLKNGKSATTILEELRALGIKLGIDDFGTGYSSLERLNRLPIDTLKIDRSFVSGMTERVESWEMVRTIVTLAHNLGMDVVAEGVETAEQMRELQLLKCDYGQGYFFSKPVEASLAAELMIHGSFIH